MGQPWSEHDQLHSAATEGFQLSGRRQDGNPMAEIRQQLDGQCESFDGQMELFFLATRSDWQTWHLLAQFVTF